MQEEIWKDVIGYEGLYQVSNLGRVKSLSKIKLNKGKYPFKTKDIILKHSLDGGGYAFVKIFNNTSKLTYKVHQLVAMTFLNHKPCGMKLIIDHINENKIDNRVENLQIVTNRYNVSKSTFKNRNVSVGCQFIVSTNKWRSQIKINNKNIHLGLFNSETEASEAYQNKLKEIIG